MYIFLFQDINSDMDQSKPECIHQCGTLGQVIRSVVYEDIMARTDNRMGSKLFYPFLVHLSFFLYL